MKSIRYVPHPEDAIRVEIELKGKFDEIEIIFDEDSKGEDYIIQVRDRLTIEDPYVTLYEGFVKRKE